MKKTLIALALSAASVHALAIQPNSDWTDVLKEAQGQTVYFNAWGGSDRINQYIDWVGEQVLAEYGVKLEHVKIGDIAEIVTQIESAKAVGKDQDGNVDLMWINGENFANMKSNELLFGDFANHLPNAAFVADKPSIAYDFSVPVEGLEAPWGGAQWSLCTTVSDCLIRPRVPMPCLRI